MSQRPLTARQRATEWLEWAAEHPDEITGPLNMAVLQKLEAQFVAYASDRTARIPSPEDVEGIARKLAEVFLRELPNRPTALTPAYWVFELLAHHVAQRVEQVTRERDASDTALFIHYQVADDACKAVMLTHEATRAGIERHKAAFADLAPQSAQEKEPGNG